MIISKNQTDSKHISIAEAREYVIPASLCACIHKVSEMAVINWIYPFGFYVMQPNFLTGVELPGNLEGRTFCYYDPTNHLKIMVAQNQSNEIWVSFGAFRSGVTEEIEDITIVGKTMEQVQTQVDKTKVVAERLTKTQHKQALSNLYGNSHPLWKQAASFIENLRKHPSIANKRMVLTGQCFGGSIAQYVGLKLKIPTYCFNSLYIGTGLQREIGKEHLSQANRYIKHVSTEGDFISNPTKSSMMHLLLKNVVFASAKNFGTSHLIPSAYTTRAETHDFFLGSLLQYIGYNNRVKSLEIPEDERNKMIELSCKTRDTRYFFSEEAS